MRLFFVVLLFVCFAELKTMEQNRLKLVSPKSIEQYRVTYRHNDKIEFKIIARKDIVTVEETHIASNSISKKYIAVMSYDEAMRKYPGIKRPQNREEQQ